MSDDQAKRGIARVEWASNVGFYGKYLVIVGDFILFKKSAGCDAENVADRINAAHELVCPAIKESAAMREAMIEALHRIESTRIWSGMDWAYPGGPSIKKAHDVLAKALRESQP